MDQRIVNERTAMQETAERGRAHGVLAARLVAYEAASHMPVRRLGDSLHRRSTPVLLRCNSAVCADAALHRSLPDGVSSKLTPAPVRRLLVGRARQQWEDLVVLVEMNPVRSMALHQAREEYVRRAGLISDVLGEVRHRIRSERFPDDVSFSVSPCIEVSEMARAWSSAPMPAFDDFRQRTASLQSNVSWSKAPALRAGAFEVYLVIKGSGRDDEPRVELLFSKLYSRCWPRSTAIMKRLRHAIAPEMAAREAEHAQGLDPPL